MERLSVILVTLNEERNIDRCLGSVRWADEIIVVDSFSTDRTVELRAHVHGQGVPARIPGDEQTGRTGHRVCHGRLGFSDRCRRGDVAGTGGRRAEDPARGDRHGRVLLHPQAARIRPLDRAWRVVPRQPVPVLPERQLLSGTSGNPRGVQYEREEGAAAGISLSSHV